MAKSPDKAQVLKALSGVCFPGFSRDIVSLGVIRGVEVAGDRVRIALNPPPSSDTKLQDLDQAIRAALRGLGVGEIRLDRVSEGGGASALRMASARPSSTAAAGGVDSGLIPEVRHTVAVASGKGGVGKSTVAVNLAVAMARQGARVGLLDADIYGPSIPLMLGISDPPRLTEDRKILPFEKYGVRAMSLGFLIDPDSAVIWRGPMVMKALEQLLRDVIWGPLDVLVVDMPPGTGDAQLTLSQRVKLAGAVIVTTPQPVALADAIKGVSMFRKVDVPVLGLVENMSYFDCPHCSSRTEIFTHGGGRAQAERLGVPCLGEIPLDSGVRRGGDEGDPIVHAAPDSPQARVFLDIAAQVRDILDGSGAENPGPGMFERFKQIWPGQSD